MEQPGKNFIENWLDGMNADSNSRRGYILLFLLAAVITLLATGVIFSLRDGGMPDRVFLSQFLLNLPFCLLIAALDIWLIWLLNRRSHGVYRVSTVLRDLLLTSLPALLLPTAINCLFMGFRQALTSSLAIVPWNWITVLLAEVFFHSREKMKAEKEKAQYQYEALKNQVNPHFLFNCLNVLSSLVYHDADKANEFTKKLSRVYRYLLDTRTRQTVPLEEELAFVENYLYLESIRFGERIQVSIVRDPAADSRQVIPASIQMLVENAFKHNVNTREAPLHLEIAVSLEGVSVSNNIQPRNHVDGHGAGLSILRQQYALYGKQIEVIDDGSSFTVRLPFAE